MTFGRVRLVATSIRHTKPRQLVARTRLQLKRRAHRWTHGLRAAMSSANGCQLTVTGAPPSAIFAPRSHLVSRVDHTTVLLLANLKWTLSTPMDWHPAALAVGTRLEKLHLHYMEYLEAVGDAQFEAIVMDWIRGNPPYREEYWLDNWNSYALSIRVTVWMQQYARRRDTLSAATRAAMETSIAAQLRFLERNLERDIGGNHLLKNVKALLWASRFFLGGQASAWQRLGDRLLAEELDEQILPDGFHFERSPSYHAQAFADLLECRALVGHADTRVRLDHVLRQMAHIVADTAHPDGHPSLFNDGGLHMTYSPAELLRAYASLSGEAVGARGSFAFKDAGYFGIRDGQDLVIADCGRVGPDHLPAHAHGDILSFEWSVGGHRVVVDAGVSEYNPGKWRRYARSTRAHNTVTVGDQDQCEFWKAFRVGRRANVTLHHYSDVDGLTLDGSHDGFTHLDAAPVHRRQLKATAGRVEVRDIVTGGAGQPVVSRLLLHPGLQVRRCAQGIEIVNRSVQVTLATSHPISIDQAWWCPDFNVRIPTIQVSLQYGDAPCEGGFHLHHHGSQHPERFAQA